jgi:hypothetical protein
VWRRKMPLLRSWEKSIAMGATKMSLLTELRGQEFLERVDIPRV